MMVGQEITYESDDLKIVTHFDKWRQFAYLVDKTTGKVIECTIPHLINALNKVSGKEGALQS